MFTLQEFKKILTVLVNMKWNKYACCETVRFLDLTRFIKNLKEADASLSSYQSHFWESDRKKELKT